MKYKREVIGRIRSMMQSEVVKFLYHSLHQCMAKHNGLIGRSDKHQFLIIISNRAQIIILFTQIHLYHFFKQVLPNCFYSNDFNIFRSNWLIFYANILFRSTFSVSKESYKFKIVILNTS